MYGEKGGPIIGFEDTPRGLTALLGTKATPILICTANYPEIPAFIDRGVKHFSSFEGINDTNLII